MGIVERPDAAAEPGSHPTPGWAIALIVLGWLIIAVTIAFTFFFAIGLMEDENPQSLLGITVCALGVVMAALALGMLLIIFGRSRRAKAIPSRVKLWAKSMIIVGLIFSVGMPMFWVGVILDVFWLRRDPTFGPNDLVASVVIAVVSFLAGVGAIVSALIWGRRQRPPEVAHVFD